MEVIDKRIIKRVCIATSYENEKISKLIKLYKYKNIKDIGKILAQYLIIYWAGQLQIAYYNDRELYNKYIKALIIPAPIDRTSYSQRGFNQVKVLTDIFAKHFELQTKDILQKRLSRKKQVELKQRQRIENVVNKYYLKRKYKNDIKDRVIIIVDDVITTGATAMEMCKVLSENGGKEIYVLTLAKG